MEKPKILVVDDEKEVLTMLCGWINRMFDCECVDSVDNGKKAIDALLTKEYDLVLMDIKMPDKNGIEVMNEVKAKKALPKIIVITAWESSAVIYEAMQAGASAYLPKPLTAETTGQKVREILTVCGKCVEKRT